MTEALLQILLILSFLAIGLIAVTFPLYAIAVNFLPQEKLESEKESKKNADPESLSAKGAVGIPVLLLLVSLISTISGIIYYYQGNQNQSLNSANVIVIISIILSTAFIAIASISML